MKPSAHGARQMYPSIASRWARLSRRAGAEEHLLDAGVLAGLELEHLPGRVAVLRRRQHADAVGTDAGRLPPVGRWSERAGRDADLELVADRLGHRRAGATGPVEDRQ